MMTVRGYIRKIDTSVSADTFKEYLKLTSLGLYQLQLDGTSG